MTTKRRASGMAWVGGVVMLCGVGGVIGQEAEAEAGATGVEAEVAAESDPVLAVVDGVEIRTSALARRVVTMFQDGGMNIHVQGAQQMMKEMQEHVLRQMITERLLQNEARGIEVGEDEVTAMLEDFKKRLPEEEPYDAYLRRYGATDAMVRGDIERNLRVKKWVEQQTADLPKPSDEEIEKIYKDRPEYAITLGKVKARHILISTDEVKEEEHGRQRIKEAKAIWDRLVGEGAEDFAAVAREVSEDPETASLGGDLGEVKEGELEEDLDRVLFTQPVGIVGPAIPTSHGLHIIKVESRTKTKHHTLKEATPVIRRDLIGKRHNERVYEIINELYEKATIQIRDEETGKLVDLEE